MDGSVILIVLLIIFFLIIVGLGVWIFFLYRNPPCTANPTLCDAYCKTACSTNCPSTSCTYVPYTIYGVTASNCISQTGNKGILTQSNNTLSLGLSSNASNQSSQWYFIPTTRTNEFYIQNVSSKGYINITPSSSAISIQSNVSSATPFQWQISKTNNINYFVFNSPSSNGCPNNAQYLTYNNTNIQMSCVQTGVTGQWWLTVPATALSV